MRTTSSAMTIPAGSNIRRANKKQTSRNGVKSSIGESLMRLECNVVSRALKKRFKKVHSQKICRSLSNLLGHAFCKGVIHGQALSRFRPRWANHPGMGFSKKEQSYAATTPRADEGP